MLPVRLCFYLAVVCVLRVLKTTTVFAPFSGPGKMYPLRKEGVHRFYELHRFLMQYPFLDAKLRCAFRSFFLFFFCAVNYEAEKIMPTIGLTDI